MDRTNNQLYTCDNYSMHSLFDEDGTSYFLCIPNNKAELYQIYFGFPKLNLGLADDDVVVDEIRNVYDTLYNNSDNNAVYLLPNMSLYEIAEANLDNDSKMYEMLYQQIALALVSACKWLRDRGNVKLYSLVKFIIQDNEDSKFAIWLESNKSDIFKSISFIQNNLELANSCDDISDKENSNHQSKKKVYIP